MNICTCGHFEEEHNDDGSCSVTKFIGGPGCGCGMFEMVKNIVESATSCNKDHKVITFYGKECPLCELIQFLKDLKSEMEHQVSKNKVSIYHLDEVLERIK